MIEILPNVNENITSHGMAMWVGSFLNNTPVMTTSKIGMVNKILIKENSDWSVKYDTAKYLNRYLTSQYFCAEYVQLPKSDRLRLRNIT